MPDEPRVPKADSMPDWMAAQLPGAPVRAAQPVGFTAAANAKLEASGSAATKKTFWSENAQDLANLVGGTAVGVGMLAVTIVNPVVAEMIAMKLGILLVGIRTVEGAFSAFNIADRLSRASARYRQSDAASSEPAP